MQRLALINIKSATLPSDPRFKPLGLRKDTRQYTPKQRGRRPAMSEHCLEAGAEPEAACPISLICLL